MKRILTFALMLCSATAQTPPSGVTASMYEQSAPELQALVQWLPVTGATQYNIYQAPAGLSSCPLTSTMKLDATTTDTSYLDDPFPGWWQLPVTGAWKSRTWCYAVSSVINGMESAKSAPVFVAIGESGYLTIQYFTACGGARIVPFPYMANQIAAHFYWTDTNNVQHEIPSIHLYNAYPYPANDPLHSYNEEWEWKTPVIATDGTTVQWNGTGKMTYTIIPPDGKSFSGSFVPQFGWDASYYNQVTIQRSAGANCSTVNNLINSGGVSGFAYSFWQNVTR